MALINIEFNPDQYVFPFEKCKSPVVYNTIPDDMKQLKYKDIITKLQDFVYNETFNINFINEYDFTFFPLADPDILNVLGDPVSAIYGVCDNIEQIFERDSYIQNVIESALDYIIIVHYIDKKENGGWRWHKYGKYIGDFEITEEYISKEKNPDLKGVWVYQIIQVTKK